MTRIGLQGENLIFLISQPRAGSTLLQRMLGSHPEIHTVSEPWIMLHPFYALRAEGHQAEYNAQAAWEGLQTFIETFPAGEEALIEGMRRMYSYVYDQALGTSDKRYFLDKTPRYYFIIPELQRVFPKAKYIILLRNPLAVLSSILDTWATQLSPLCEYRHDLIRAPHLLLNGPGVLGDQAIIVHYEKLVRNPTLEMQKICDKLGLTYTPEILDYGHHGHPRWNYGDQKEVYQHTRPVHQDIEKWVLAIDNPQTWRLVHDYLRLLGQEIVERMGYSYEGLWQVLQEHRPNWIKLWATFSMRWVLETCATQRTRFMRSLLSLVGFALRHGFRGTWAYAIRRLYHRFSKAD